MEVHQASPREEKDTHSMIENSHIEQLNERINDLHWKVANLENADALIYVLQDMMVLIEDMACKINSCQAIFEADAKRNI